MNRVNGVSLDKFLQQETLSFIELARVFRDIALALQHAHDRDVVHRDVKPKNIMVRPSGEPVVIDFGLAKRLDLSDLERSFTASHAVVGTLGYLAPEQAQMGKREITRAVDVYGLGATLYYALTGHPPLDRSDFWRAVAELRSKTPERPRLLRADIPSDLELICLKCLEKRPSDRYESMQHLADDLERFAQGRSVTVRPASWLRKQIRWCQANPLIASLATTLLVSVTAGLISTVVLWRQADYRWRQSQSVLTQAEEILKTGVSAAETLLPQTAGALEYRQQQLEQTLAFRKRLNALSEPERVNHRSVAVLHFLLGKICARRGLYDESLQHYQEALNRFSSLLAATPRDERLRFDLFHSLLGLDSVRARPLGSETRSLTQLEEALAVIEGLVEDYPNNHSYRDALACNLLLISGLVRESDPVGSRDYAQRSYREAVELKRQLPNPCLEWRHVGTAAGALAEICFASQDWAGAETWLNVAQTAIEDYLQRPNLDPGEWTDLSGCFLLRRRLALVRGQWDVAQAWELRWRELLHKSAEKYPDYFVFREHLNNADSLFAEGARPVRQMP
jgi:tetratricopeptide (TPR) repeat protein